MTNTRNSGVDGTPDNGRHPAIVALVLGNKGLCTGALIAPDAVLTARHCVSQTTEEIHCPAKTTQIIGEHKPESIAVLVGDKIGTAHEVARGRQILTLPQNDLCGNDIAVIRLNRSISAIKPVTIRMNAPVDTGQKIDLVGFGRRGEYAAVGEKYYRREIRVLDATYREFMTEESTCRGDSGGPALDSRTGSVVGVVSRGDPSCDRRQGLAIYTQTSAFPELLRDITKTDGQSSAETTL